MPRKYPESCTHRLALGWGFNEAGADAPEIPLATVVRVAAADELQ